MLLRAVLVLIRAGGAAKSYRSAWLVTLVACYWCHTSQVQGGRLRRRAAVRARCQSRCSAPGGGGPVWPDESNIGLSDCSGYRECFAVNLDRWSVIVKKCKWGLWFPIMRFLGTKLLDEVRTINIIKFVAKIDWLFGARLA